MVGGFGVLLNLRLIGSPHGRGLWTLGLGLQDLRFWGGLGFRV